MDWRSDIDHDGFAWADGATAPFMWLGQGYPTLEAFSAAVGVYPNGLSIPLTDVAIAEDRVVVQPWSSAVDAGAVLPNMLPTVGTPDLGAHEVGVAERHIGPRPW